MASSRRSLLSVLCLSLILFNITAAHPNGRNHDRRQSLELSIEKFDANETTYNTTITTNNVDQDLSKLPKPLKDFLNLLGLGLKLFGDALASLLDDKVVSGNTTTTALLTEIPNLATLVPAVPTSSWANTSTPPASPSSSRSRSTSYLTVTSTRVLTVTRSRPASSASVNTTVPAVPSTPALIKQNTLAFEKQNAVQVYAGRYPGITRTIADLETLCSDSSIDIITLAGVTTFFSDVTQRPIPVADFDSLCNNTLSLTPTGEGECNALSGALRKCQTEQNKKLFLAIETGTESTTLYNPREARTLARLLWDMFGAGKAMASGAKLYGGPPLNSLGIVFDGFEFLVNTTTIDDEYFAAFNKAKRQSVQEFVPPTLPFFDTLFETLRALFTTSDTSKPYYLSVSLPCTRPSILSKKTLHLTDFVSVRFMNDIACNINGLAFTNFLETWGKDIVNTVPKASTVSKRTTTMQTTRLRTTTIAAPRAVTSQFRLIDPNYFSVPRHPTLTLSQTLELVSFPTFDDNQKRQLQDAVIPFFILGIPVPSQEVQNATAISGVGSADPSTISAILDHARSTIPNFGGVLLWGSVQDMGIRIGQGNAYLSFINSLLESAVPVVPSISAAPVLPITSTSMFGPVPPFQGDDVSFSTASNGDVWGWRRPRPFSPYPRPTPPSGWSEALVAWPSVTSSTDLPPPPVSYWNEVPTISPSVTISVEASISAAASVEAAADTPTFASAISSAWVSSQSEEVVTLRSTRILTATIVRSSLAPWSNTTSVMSA